MNTKQKTIGVFFGSRSPEHDVSIITAQLIISQLNRDGYDVVPVYMTKKGEWLLGTELGNLKKFTDPLGRVDVKKFGNFYLDLEASRGKLVFVKKGLIKRTWYVDIAFPALHGSFGEDGSIQGLFEMLQVPYVGCDVASSALAMDKVLTKLICVAKGLPTTQFLYFLKSDWNAEKVEITRKIQNELKWPVFIKPARLGSSIGVAKATSEQDLELAIEVALHYDDKFLVEECVENLMDVTCAVIGNANPQTSLLQESLFSGSDFFSYEEKYLKKGGAQFGKAASNLVIPARLDDATSNQIRHMAERVYKIFGLSGIARVDFLFDKTAKKFYVIEINPMPGTLYHHLWKASGLDLSELLNKLLEFAMERYRAKEKNTYTFASDLLRKTNSIKLGF